MRLYMPFSFSAGKSGRYCRPLRKPLKWQCHLSGAGDIRSCTRGALFLLWEQTFFYSQATKSHQVKPLPTDATPLSAASLLRPGALREESQSLRAVLREVSQCDENTKPSLRIFHLQQLASLRNTDVLLLQQQPQVKDLLERLTLDAGHLSPPQLHALLLSAAKLQIPSNHRVWRVALHQLLRHTQVSKPFPCHVSAQSQNKGVAWRLLPLSVVCEPPYSSDVAEQGRYCSRSLQRRPLLRHWTSRRRQKEVGVDS